MLTLLLSIFLYFTIIGFVIKAIFWVTKVWLKLSLSMFLLGIIVFGIFLIL